MTAHPHILLAAAVLPEIQAVLDVMPDAETQRIGGRDTWTGRAGGMPVRIIVTGPGPVNTVQALTACLEAERPALLLQAGCGGGFSEFGLANGDLAVAMAEIDVHLGLDTGEHFAPPASLPFPVLETGGRALREIYPLDSALAGAAFLRLKEAFGPQGIGVFRGPFVTGSTVTGSDVRAAFLFRAFSPCIESMEGAAAAFLSQYYRLPFLEIRCVSNRVGKRDLSRWDLSLACRRAGEAAAVMLSYFNEVKHVHPVISGIFHMPQ